MIAAVDVHYAGASGHAACITFADWTARSSRREYVAQLNDVGEYEPGAFWKRELPCILAVLASVEEKLHTVVIDGYVWLDDSPRPGLGAHLFEALGKTTAVVGVAKTAFRGSEHAVHVLRAGSQRPLFVTAEGIALDEAAAHVAQMSGTYRTPDLLKRVDQLARGRPLAVQSA